MFVDTHAHEYPDFTAIRLRSNDVLTVGDQGVQLYATARDYLEGSHPVTAIGDPVVLPGAGWLIASLTCENTGGGCMVDFVTFVNGYRLTINEETAVFWPPMTAAEFDAAFYSEPELAIDWLYLPDRSTDA